MGWEYQLLDEGWMVPYSRTADKENQPGYDPDAKTDQRYLGYYSWTKELIDYAKSKDVKLIVWAHKNDLTTEKQRERLKYWAELGIAGIKPDFFDSASQSTLGLCHELLEDTAQYGMVINLHGSVKAAGERRTYPNALTKEAVGGAEGYAVEDWRDANNYGGGDKPWGGYNGSNNNGTNDAARYTCTLPFTRGAVGPMDYTPLASFGARNNVRFGPVDPDNPNKRQEFTDPSLLSLAHQFALPIVYESGIQCLADKPASYQNLEGYENYWKSFPAQWDESRLVNGEVGKLVEMARRHGTDWYLGVICSYTENTDVSIPLDFLEDGATYTAYIYCDNVDSVVPATEAEAKDPNLDLNKYVAYKTVQVTSEDSLDLTLAGVKTPVYEYTFKNADGTTTTAKSRSDLHTSGGAAVRFVKNEEPTPEPAAKHTVTFDSNGGSAVEAVTLEDGQAVAKPADPTREGYTFAGWFADKGLKTAYDFSAPVTGDLTLYAKWAKNAAGENPGGNQGDNSQQGNQSGPNGSKNNGNATKGDLPQTGDASALQYIAAGTVATLATGAFHAARKINKQRSL